MALSTMLDDPRGFSSPQPSQYGPQPAFLFRLIVLAFALCSLSGGQSDRLYAQGAPTDPTVAKARAAIERGQYTEAEALLRPAAGAAPTGDAALELGLLLQSLGRRDDARMLLEPIMDLAIGSRTQAADYARLGRAARAMGEFQLANDAYRRAAAMAPDDPAVNTGWGELFLQAHNNEEAAKSFRAALEANENWIPAHLGLARALVDDNPPEAMEIVRRVLSLEPTSVSAHLFLAELHLDRSDRDTAKAVIAKAKAINPVGLEALALGAAIAYVEGRLQDFEAEIAVALKITPRYSDIYRIAGDQAASNYRFEEAAALTRKAIALDPDDVRAHAALGVHLLRTGEEAEARTELERAFKADPYDVVTYNLLNMLDTLEKFETVREGDLVIRLDPKEAPVMREYAGPLATRALAALAERYQFTPRGPILIEMFSRHDDFAVRNVGLPGMIGALGACFGRVVTLDSPKARPPGTFHWGATLWHELAHVVTLQMSRQRVPRWLTEGISEYEEKRASPDWGRDMDLTFAQAFARGDVIPLRELNAAFTNPEKITLAYFQASLVVEHIVSGYGQAALRNLLFAYGDGLEGEPALVKGLGVDLRTLQAGFTKMVGAQFAPMIKALSAPSDLGAPNPNVEAIAAANPGSYPAQLALGQFLWRAGRLDEAFRALERAATLVPMATGDDSPHVLMAQMALQQKDRDRAIKELEGVLQYAHTDHESLRLLVKLLEEAGDRARLASAYDRLIALDPFDAAAHSRLGRLALERKDPRTAAREFRAALAAGALDPAAAHFDLAESYLAAGDRTQAKQQALAALEIAPGYERAQDLLLRLVEGQ